MGPQDAAVWRAALAEGLIQAERFTYDVRLGGALGRLVTSGHELSGMWLNLMKKRIDVVAWSGLMPTVIEVKPVGSFAALGQCLGYGYLWEQKHSKGPKPKLCCVCAICDPDLKPAFAAFGVQVVELSPSEAERVLMPVRVRD